MATFNTLGLTSRLIPGFIGDSNDSSGNGLNGLDFNGATDSLEFVFMAPATDTITKLAVCYSARQAGTPVAHQISLQGVTTATGRADGTIKSGTNAKGAFTPPASSAWDDTVQWITLTSSYAMTIGELLSIVIVPTGVPDGSNHGSINGGSVQGVRSTVLPYWTSIDAGVATRKDTHPVFGLQSATATYGFPIASAACATYSSGSSPNEKALTFTLGNPSSGTYQVGGIRALLKYPITGTSASVILYDSGSGTTPQQTATIYGDVKSNNGNAAGDCYCAEIYFPGLTTLNYGTQYHIGILAASATSAVGVKILTLAAAGDLSALGGGSNWHLATRAGAAWTEVTTQIPCIDLILADSTPPAGGGSTIFNIME